MRGRVAERHAARRQYRRLVRVQGAITPALRPRSTAWLGWDAVSSPASTSVDRYSSGVKWPISLVLDGRLDAGLCGRPTTSTSSLAVHRVPTRPHGPLLNDSAVLH